MDVEETGVGCVIDVIGATDGLEPKYIDPNTRSLARNNLASVAAKMAGARPYAASIGIPPHRGIVHLMQEIYAGQRRGNTLASHPTSGTVPPSAEHRGTGAKSAGRELQQMRELPWVDVR